MIMKISIVTHEDIKALSRENRLQCPRVDVLCNISIKNKSVFVANFNLRLFSSIILFVHSVSGKGDGNGSNSIYIIVQGTFSCQR